MKKNLLFILLVFIFVACGNNNSTTKTDKLIENAYIDNSSGNTITNIEQTRDEDERWIDDIDDYDYDKKSGYNVSYMLNGKEPLCHLRVYAYRKENKIIFFKTFITCGGFDDSFSKRCDIEVNGNTMTSIKLDMFSDDCGNKEGEVVTKILNAIENKTYFDY